MNAKLKTLSLCFALVSFFAFNTAVAGGAHNAVTQDSVVAVSYHDLNLASDAGLDRLYGRVKFAAQRVCGVENMRVSLDIVRNHRACVDSAMNKAIGEINDTRLTNLHKARQLEARQS